ncbi:MAG: class I SAM-dependent methyltransferase [Acidimicrobiia bacterium]|nr:class I SAM-dependent methyltransferase [Acidimicrobiia bacterium]MBT8193324.1 class I SAM-dependent methyltransferase [Acidimicrobiia bacterium]NNF87770.1 class I SAM-dependent methyltransferase [Acidimicrobiia bacterium]NNJ47299.1 class I SAM-dependent methyltransferase [Acidimicrobiia bacterium]NNL12765.1 class I SAM-dependent methyltransferase [Acidimicrobiia bacterium]
MPDEPEPILPSAELWDAVYAGGGTSGTGSYGRLAEFKAEVVNRLLVEHSIKSVIELGCGDGNQASLIDYPGYLGLDISPTAIGLCRERFGEDPTRAFRTYRTGDELADRAELAISLDVIYHLLEDEVYERYMSDLFAVATRFVVVYSSDTDEETEWPEVRHHRFTDWVREHATDWTLQERIPNRYPYVPGDVDSSWADFYVFAPNPVRRRWWNRG